jgi:hypothetical protein
MAMASGAVGKSAVAVAGAADANCARAGAIA